MALIERRGKFLVAEPFFGAGPRLAMSRDSRYDVGDLVLVTPGTSGRSGKGSRARVQRRIGRPDNARDVIEGVMLDRGLSRGFEGPVARDAREASDVKVEAGAGRRDLRAMPTFTIDPETAKDFDDAISCKPADGGGWSVWVHIADVSAYVPARSPIDREAYRRATSVYVPGAVEPMLPPELSNGACSLVPDEDRLAVTVEMLIRGSDVVSAAFYRSVIRSDKRLSLRAGRRDLRGAGSGRGRVGGGPGQRSCSGTGAGGKASGQSRSGAGVG